MAPRDDCTSSTTSRAIFISQDGSAIYSFEDIVNTKDCMTQTIQQIEETKCWLDIYDDKLEFQLGPD